MANVTRRDALAIAATSAFALTTPALADAPAPFSANEIVDDGNRFFGALSRGMADVVQEAASRWGLPAQRVYSWSRGLRRIRGRSTIWRGQNVYAECRQQAGILARAVAWMLALTGIGQ
jgi:hypothetical protein